MRKETRIILYPVGFALVSGTNIDGKTVIYSRTIFYFVENYAERGTRAACRTLIIIKSP